MAVRPQDSLGLTGPLVGGQAITASDTTTYSPLLRGLYVGVSGDVRVIFGGGDDVIFTNLAAGVIHPIADISQIMSTSTNATGIVCGQ